VSMMKKDIQKDELRVLELFDEFISAWEKQELELSKAKIFPYLEICIRATIRCGRQYQEDLKTLFAAQKVKK